MRITLTVEVESREALAAILNAGIEYSLYDCQVLNFQLLPDPSRRPRRSIARWIADGKLPQGYALTTNDVGTLLTPESEGFGPVQTVDVGKRCYVGQGIFSMESREQRDQREQSP